MFLKEVEKLLEYSGLAQKPADFDQFWYDKLAKIAEFEPEYSLEKVDIASNLVDCYKLRFKSFDGCEIACKLLQPKEISEKLRGILMFHGYQGDSGDFSDKIALAAEGNVVLAMDCRGQAGESEYISKVHKGTVFQGLIIRGVEEGKEHLYYKDVYLDLVITARLLMSFTYVDENDIRATGESQGGALALICAALEPRVKRVLINYPFLCDFRQAYQLGVEESAYAELAYWFRYRDPLHRREVEFFNTLEYIDVQNFVERIEAKLIMGVGLEDKTCRPETQFAAFNKVKSPKKLLVLPEFQHEYFPEVADMTRGFLLFDAWDEIRSYPLDEER